MPRVPTAETCRMRNGNGIARTLAAAWMAWKRFQRAKNLPNPLDATPSLYRYLEHYVFPTP